MMRPCARSRAASGTHDHPVMQGERALPGIEITRRLDKAFERAGL